MGKTTIYWLAIAGAFLTTSAGVVLTHIYNANSRLPEFEECVLGSLKSVVGRDAIYILQQSCAQKYVRDITKISVPFFERTGLTAKGDLTFLNYSNLAILEVCVTVRENSSGSTWRDCDIKKSVAMLVAHGWESFEFKLNKETDLDFWKNHTWQFDYVAGI